MNAARLVVRPFRLHVAFLVVVAVALSCSGSDGPHFVDNADCADISREQLPRTIAKLHFDIGYDVEVDAEVADTTEAQGQGLMCRSAVPDGTGMLFLFTAERSGPFWMFNTYVDLDAVYVAADGSVSDIKRMTRCTRNGESREVWAARCGAESESYAPSSPYKATIELPAGWLDSITRPGTSLQRVSWERVIK